MVTSWIESLGTFVLSSALEMTVEMILNDSVDSLPPFYAVSFELTVVLRQLYEPFRIAAFADLIAKEAMFAITSGRASKMINKTPIGHD